MPGSERPPGPKPKYLLGNLPLLDPDPLAVYTRYAHDYGDIFHYRVLWVHVYFLNHPDYIDYVLVRNSRNFIKDRTLRNSRWVLGEGLLTSEGDHWKRQRRLAQPAFHREKIAGYAQTMTDFTSQMLRTWRAGEQIDIHHEMMQLTLRIVVQCLFGMETGETRAISRSLDLVMARNTGLWLVMPPALQRLPWPGSAPFHRAIKDLNLAVNKIIAARRQTQSESDDLLAMLMNARDEDGTTMDDKQVRDEVTTFFLAGHETTALAVSWALYLLSENPEAEQSLHEELDRVLADRPATMDDIPRLIWTEAVVKETLRLYPPAWAMGRTALEDFELGGYTIPKGSSIILSQWVVQRDARFFPEPDKFRPGRWLEDPPKKLPRFAYFPFGGGPRQCIGINFAMMEAVLLIATIARRFRVKVTPDYKPKPVPGFTLRPKAGIPASIEAKR